MRWFDSTRGHFQVCHDRAVPREHRTGEPHDGLRRFAKRVLIAVAIVAGIVLIGYLGAAFLPRWWAHRIAAQTGGSFTAGIALGLFYGAVFIALPLLVLRWAFRRRRSLKVWTWAVLIAGLLALPNLLTLGIVLGRGGAAHAGERTLDVEAPGFRASTLAGAIAAVVLLLLLEYLVRSRNRSRAHARSLRDELRHRDDPPVEAGAPERPPDRAT